jgi:hypothetical protein
MSADDLVRESGSTGHHAADIQAVSLNSGSHHSEADGDLDERPRIRSVDIEAVAQLARFYAAGPPLDEEFRSIKEWINARGNDLVDNWKSSPLSPKVPGIAQEIRSRRATYDLSAADDSLAAAIRAELDDFASARGSSIHAVPRQSGFKDRLVSARALTRGRISHVAIFSFAAVIGLTILWHSFEAKQIVSRWVSLLDRSLWIYTQKSPPVLVTSSELLRRAAGPPEITAPLHRAKQNDAQLERIYADGRAVRGAKQNTRSKRSVRSLEKRVPLPVPETTVTTIEGWMLREVNNGAAVLEGPNGIWTARQGDTVPGVGRVDSIVRWGERWIVATSGGLISTP